MPALRGSRGDGTAAGYRFASELPVGSLAGMLPFLRHALRIRRSLDRSIAEAAGVVAYELIADMGGRRFTVESTWTDEAAFRAWIGGTTHVAAMRDLGSRVGGRARFEQHPLADASPGHSGRGA